jgi:hypothetical protein
MVLRVSDISVDATRSAIPHLLGRIAQTIVFYFFVSRRPNRHGFLDTHLSYISSSPFPCASPQMATQPRCHRTCFMVHLHPPLRTEDERPFRTACSSRIPTFPEPFKGTKQTRCSLIGSVKEAQAKEPLMNVGVIERLVASFVWTETEKGVRTGDAQPSSDGVTKECSESKRLTWAAISRATSTTESLRLAYHTKIILTCVVGVLLCDAFLGPSRFSNESA